MSVNRAPASWLRMFEVAARHLSFTGAAAELQVTPSAVSQQIRMLERRLGKELFHRHPRGLRLTVAGETLVPVCRETFDRLDTALLELFGRRDGQQLVIRVALGFTRSWLLQRLATFANANPDLHIRMVASVWAGEPLDPNVDLDIRLASGPIAGMTSHQLTRDELFPACNPALLKGPTPLNRPADLASQCLLHTIGFAQGWAHWLAAAGVKRCGQQMEIEFDSMLLSAEMAASGHGVALVRTSYARDLIDSGKLVPMFDIRLTAKDNVFVAHAHSLSAESPAARFRNWLLDDLKDV